MDQQSKINTGVEVPASPRRFYTVAEAAAVIGTAPVTLYRAIRDGEFPAVRIRGRLIVPAKAIEALADAAVAAGATVDLAEFDVTVTRRRTEGLV